jgi:hypothetical protein
MDDNFVNNNKSSGSMVGGLFIIGILVLVFLLTGCRKHKDYYREGEAPPRPAVAEDRMRVMPMSHRYFDEENKVICYRQSSDTPYSCVKL